MPKLLEIILQVLFLVKLEDFNMPLSPTSRSLRYLREKGYVCQIVEHFHFYMKRRIDLFGFIDILAIKGKETLAIQTTANMSNAQVRVRKILNSEYYKLVKNAGWKIEVHGWRKLVIGKFKNGKNKKGWVNKVIEL